MAGGTSVPRSANATKNPFLGSVPSTKRRLENEEGENYIFGNVRQPMKRSRIGESLRCGIVVSFDYFGQLKVSRENHHRDTNVEDVNLRRYVPLAADYQPRLH
jgi:hypothetical protein